MSNLPKEVSCNLCGSSKNEVFYSTFRKGVSGVLAEDERVNSYAITEHTMRLPLRIVKCSECGLLYTNPRQPLKMLLSNYDRMVDQLYVVEEEGRRLSARPILDELERSGKKGRLLEIGCSAGFFIDEARKRGWEVYGIELSKWACDYARDNLGIKNIFHGKLQKTSYESDYFDAVVMKDTIEHLVDPKGTLIELKRILKSDGTICLTTPDISSFISRLLKTHWWGVNETHFYFFSRKSIIDILRATGFTVKKIGFHTRIFSMRYLMLKLKDYNKVIYSIFHPFFNNNLMGRKLIRINLRDQIELYAKKGRA